MTPAAPRFRLDPRLAPGAAVRRLALSQLDHARAGLARGDTRGIHEARKSCKKLRALLRLVRGALGAAYRPQNRRLRDTARALSPLREAAVLRATARSFGIGLAAGDRRPDTTAALRRALRLTAAQRRAIDRWALDDVSRDSLAAAVAAGYRRARRSGKQARRRPRPAVLHEWRKQVKYHRHQCEAAAPLWPGLARRVRALEALGEALGRHHDVEMLAQELRRRPWRAAGADLVFRTAQRLHREQARLAARALRAGERLLAESARAWSGATVGP